MRRRISAPTSAVAKGARIAEPACTPPCHDLSPRECARIVNDVGRRADLAPNGRTEALIEASEQLLLVAEEPGTAAPGGGSWSVVRRVIRPKF